MEQNQKPACVNYCVTVLLCLNKIYTEHRGFKRYYDTVYERHFLAVLHKILQTLSVGHHSLNIM